MIYTSRYSNKELKSCKYTTLRISIGIPKWPLGYRLDGELKELMPFGLMGLEFKEFKEAYLKKLDSLDIERLQEKLCFYEKMGKPVVLLCYEDIRKGDSDWCHRTIFSEWWLKNTGELIEELHDPSPMPIKKAVIKVPIFEQTSLF